MTVLLTAVERSTLLEATPHGAVAAVTRQYELVAAAVAVQRALAAEQWPGTLVVRLGDRPAGLQRQSVTQGRLHVADTGVKPI